MSSWQLLLIILKRTGTTRVNRPIRSACNFNSLTMKILKPALSGKETWAGGTIHMQQISVWLKCRLLDVIADTETTLIWYLYLFPVCFGICVYSYLLEQLYITSVRLLSGISVKQVGPVFEKAEGQIFDSVILKLKTLFSCFHLVYVSADIWSKITG